MEEAHPLGNCSCAPRLPCDSAMCACLSAHACIAAARQAQALRVLPQPGGSAHSPTLKSSRYTARCPSIVLCTPCSGVERGVLEPALRVWGLEKRHDGQAACEPGGGEYGGVPDHPPRLHNHRTSPAQALLTTLIETC
jgi:hypothetical protein